MEVSTAEIQKLPVLAELGVIGVDGRKVAFNLL